MTGLPNPWGANLSIMIAAYKIRNNFSNFQADVNLENAEIFAYSIAAERLHVTGVARSGRLGMV